MRKLSKRVSKSLKRFGASIKQKTSRHSKRVTRFVERRPFPSFFAILGIFLALIVLSNILGAPKQVEKKEEIPVKQVRTYSVGRAPKLTVSAKVEKSGVIRITALTGGVVQAIYKKEGDSFYRGQTLVYLSTNYQGGNAASLQTKLAQLQYQATLDTEKTQRDIIQKQRDLSDDENASGKKPSDDQQDLTNLQLDVQNRQLDLARETQLTSVQLAQVTEAMMYPAAPFNGTVQRVSVKVGQAVNPGQELMVISERIEEDPVKAVVFVSEDIARSVSTTEPSVLHLNGKTLQTTPFYVSQDAVQGTLYAVYFDIPDVYRTFVTEGGSIAVDLPIERTRLLSAVTIIPVDAVYQTKDQDYLFVETGGRAASRAVKLGTVYGSFVTVEKGLADGDRVILDRNVIAGDRVRVN